MYMCEHLYGEKYRYIIYTTANVCVNTHSCANPSVYLYFKNVCMLLCVLQVWGKVSYEPDCNVKEGQSVTRGVVPQQPCFTVRVETVSRNGCCLFVVLLIDVKALSVGSGTQAIKSRLPEPVLSLKGN